MHNYIVMASMKGQFLAQSGNTYDNFQMLGYIESESAEEAIENFISQPQFPIVWNDVEYMWAEELTENQFNGHYGSYRKIYIQNQQPDISD